MITPRFLLFDHGDCGVAGERGFEIESVAKSVEGVEAVRLLSGSQYEGKDSLIRAGFYERPEMVIFYHGELCEDLISSDIDQLADFSRCGRSSSGSTSTVVFKWSSQNAGVTWGRCPGRIYDEGKVVLIPVVQSSELCNAKTLRGLALVSYDDAKAALQGRLGDVASDVARSALQKILAPVLPSARLFDALRLTYLMADWMLESPGVKINRQWFLNAFGLLEDSPLGKEGEPVPIAVAEFMQDARRAISDNHIFGSKSFEQLFFLFGCRQDKDGAWIWTECSGRDIDRRDIPTGSTLDSFLGIQ